MAVDFIDRLHIFLVAFADLRAIRLHDEPVGEHLLEGGLPGATEGGQQRELEPPAMLIGAFEVEIGGEF